MKRIKRPLLRKDLEWVKWFLWHGNVYKALQVLDDLTWDINAEASNEAQKLAKTGKSNRDVIFL